MGSVWESVFSLCEREMTEIFSVCPPSVHTETLCVDSSLFLLLLLEQKLVPHVTKANSDCVKFKTIPCSEQGKLFQRSGSPPPCSVYCSSGTSSILAANFLFSTPLTLIAKVV